MQKNVSRRTQSNEELHEMDLREKLSRTFEPVARYHDARSHVIEPRHAGPIRRIPPTRSADDLLQVDSSRKSDSAWKLDGLRHRSPDRIISSSRYISPPRSVAPLRHIPPIRPGETSRPTHPFVSKDVVEERRPSNVTLKSALPAEHGKPVLRLPPPTGAVQKAPYPAEEPLTVSGLLNSLGLGKYALIFQAEEVDMAALKQMGDNDLKELGIPMGPRKKILLAILHRLRRRLA